MTENVVKDWERRAEIAAEKRAEARAETEWDEREARSAAYLARLDWWMDNIDWHDVAQWTDAEADLAQILFLLEQGRTDEALDCKDRLKRLWAEYMEDMQ